jgi:hypothetical protein
MRAPPPHHHPTTTPAPPQEVPPDVLQEFEHRLEEDLQSVAVTLTAVTGVIIFWRGVWSLLDCEWRLLRWRVCADAVGCCWFVACCLPEQPVRL